MPHNKDPFLSKEITIRINKPIKLFKYPENLVFEHIKQSSSFEDLYLVCQISCRIAN